MIYVEGPLRPVAYGFLSTISCIGLINFRLLTANIEQISPHNEGVFVSALDDDERGVVEPGKEPAHSELPEQRRDEPEREEHRGDGQAQQQLPRMALA